MASKSNNRKSPTIPIQGFVCDWCGGPKSILESKIEKGEYRGKKKKFCSKECKSSWELKMDNVYTRVNKLKVAIDKHCPPCDAAKAKYKYILSQLKNQSPSQGGGMRGGATEITDNTLEKKLIDATAPYNEKAAKNAKNFAKASIEVGKAILDQLDLNPLAFIEKAKELGVKIYKITQEGIYLLFPGDANIGQSVDKLIKSGTKLYFIPVRILGTIAITIFLSMFGVSIDLKFLEKIPGLKPFIDLIIKYTSIITQILKNLNIPGLSIPTLSIKNLLFPNVIDAAYRKGDYEGGSKKKKKKTRRKLTRKTKRKKN